MGSQIGGYRVTGLIGRGGMGTVYLAESEEGDHVALKVLAPELDKDEEFRRRFLREARYASSLDHPHVVAVRDVGEVDRILYMAMQYVQGTDLQTLLALEGSLDPAHALSVMGQVASALDTAHTTGLLHRDVKPGNVLIASGHGPEPAGHCYLTDFGLSKNPTKDSAALTAVGDFVGTLFYTAPEQILTEEVDHRADIYSVACVLYETLAGRPPFMYEQDADLLEAQVSEPPPKLTALRPDLPAAIDDVIGRAMAKDPAKRHSTCMELVESSCAALGLAPAVVGEAPAHQTRSDAAAAPPGDRWRDSLPLEATSGPGAGTKISVTDELQIGRHAAGPGTLGGDVAISARHARICRGPDGTYLVEDLGSRNGTLLNGRRLVEPRALRVGDIIEVGDTTLITGSDPGLRGRPATGRPPSPKLCLSLEIDVAAGEAWLRLDESSEPLRLLYLDGGWRLAA